MNAQAHLTPQLMLSIFEVAKKIGEMDDTCRVGLGELHASPHTHFAPFRVSRLAPRASHYVYRMFVCCGRKKRGSSESTRISPSRVSAIRSGVASAR